MLRTLFNPISAASLILMLLALHWFLRGQKRKACLTAVLTLSVVIPSLPVVGKPLLLILENRYPLLSPSAYPAADAIVLLGGTTSRVSSLRPFPGEVFGNRVLRAAQLFHAKRAPRVIVTGGKPYVAGGERRTEADDMAALLHSLGVAKDAILIESKAESTRQNAEFSARLAQANGLKSILLVSNGFHLPRAMRYFKREFENVTPAPSDKLVEESRNTFVDFIPNPPALLLSMIALRELGANWWAQWSD